MVITKRVIRLTLVIWLSLLILSVVVGTIPGLQLQAHADEQSYILSPSEDSESTSRAPAAASSSDWAQGAPSAASANPVAQSENLVRPALLNNTGYFGGNLGLSRASDGIGWGWGYGGEVVFFPQPEIGVGGLYRGADYGQENYNFFGGQVLIRTNIGHTSLHEVAVGLMLGGANAHNVNNNSGTSVAYGGRVHYDYRFAGSIISVGPEFNAIFLSPTDNTIATLNFLASLKLWL